MTKPKIIREVTGGIISYYIPEENPNFPRVAKRRNRQGNIKFSV